MSHTDIEPFVYIAGAYGDKDGYLVIEERMQRARSAAAECAKRGIPYYSPHLNCAHFEAIVPEVGLDFWVRQDAAFLPHASALLVITHGWASSVGTKAEIAEAQRLGIPSFWFPTGNDERGVTVLAGGFLDMVEWWKHSFHEISVSAGRIRADETDPYGEKIRP